MAKRNGWIRVLPLMETFQLLHIAILASMEAIVMRFLYSTISTSKYLQTIK